MPAPINGTPNADTLPGTAGDDVINGLGGNDRIDSGAGNDVINGGDGNDVINAGAGNDTITGGLGNDTIIGGTGQDTAVYSNTTIAAASTHPAAIGSWNGAILTLATGAEGTDTLNQVESLNFNGQVFAVTGYNGTTPFNVVANLGADSNSGNDGGIYLSGNVLANDYDVDSQLAVTGARSANSVSQPAFPIDDPKAQANDFITVGGHYGILHIYADGHYDYHAILGSGVDHFQYSVTDGGVARWVNLDITVNHVNRLPVAQSILAGGDEDTVITGSVVGTDADNDPLTFVLVSGPDHGSLTFHSDGTYSYTPDADYSGGDGFLFKVNDGHGDSNTAFVALTIDAVNDAPVLQDVSTGILEDQSTSFTDLDFLRNAITFDNDSERLTYALVSGPSHGSLDYHSDGTFTYTPDADYNGTDSFTFKANDGNADSNVATWTFGIEPVNDAPVANYASVSATEDTVLTGAVSASDVDHDKLIYSLVSGPAHGSLVFHNDGTYSYTPDADYNGSDQFTFKANDGTVDSGTETVAIYIEPVNDAPTASGGANSGDEDTTISGQVAGGDVDDDKISFHVVSGPAHGSLSFNLDGSYSYTPNADFNGSDSFTFASNDGAVDSAPATVSLTVNPVNDAPVAGDGSASGNEDSNITGSAHASDVDHDNLSYSLASQAQHGSVSLGSDGSYTYTPNANYHGSDSFDFQVSDGHGGTDYGHITINVASVNDLPVAADASASLAEDGSVSGTLSATDADGDALSFSVASNPAHGSLSLGTDGHYVYTPNANYHGADSFDFTVSDGHGGTDTGHVAITITSVNDAPVGNVGSFSGAEDSNITGTVTANDVDGDHLTYSIYNPVSLPSGAQAISVGVRAQHGGVVFHSDGSFVYTPDANYHGSDSFQFRAFDGTVFSAPTTVYLNVSSVNDVPVAQTGSFSINEDSFLSGSVHATDADEDRLTFSLYSSAPSAPGGSDATPPSIGTQHGRLSFQSNGTFFYTPDANYHGSDSFQYRAFDGQAYSAPTTVYININSVNDAPVANAPGTVNTGEDTAISGQASGSDVDLDSLTWSLVSGLDGLSFSSDGAWTFNPNSNATAQALDGGQTADLTFSYRAYDGTAYSEPVTATVHVIGADEAPINGTGARDILNGTAYGETINGLAGADDLYGLGGNDTINGGDGNDKLFGGDGADTLNGNAGNDTVNGEAGDDTLNGNDGNDTMDGGDGNDTVDGGAGIDIVKGGAGNDHVYGGLGNDNVQGGLGDDFVYGGAGTDTLAGGAGADTFVFADGDLTNSAATTDTIVDFKTAQGDILDLSAIDANTGLGGNQGFSVVGSFSHTAGELTLSYNGGTNVTTVAMDTNGDGVADYLLQLSGNVSSTAGWVL